VVLAHDQVLVRAGFRGLLDRSDASEVLAEAATGTEAVERTLTTQPDVVPVDVRMPVMDGLFVACGLCAPRPRNAGIT
jgi:YesN/AraC family two-component response regulator